MTDRRRVAIFGGGALALAAAGPLIVIAASPLGPGAATAQTVPEPAPRPGINLYGVTGLIDMPSAFVQPDGEVTATASSFAGITRSALSFQILPRVQGSFRYTGIDDLDFFGFETYYDRSFDVSLQVLREGARLPAVKIGFQDFVGTGLYSGEYVAASKRLGERVSVTAGLGWGRLSGGERIGTPFRDRDDVEIGLGGEFNLDQWFGGPAAPFAGVEWRATDALTLLAEYSSDRYEIEQGREGGPGASSRVLSVDGRVNVGARYRLNDAVTFGAHYLYGSELGFSVTLGANPSRPPVSGSIAPAPQPVAQRGGSGGYPTAWARSERANAVLLAALEDELEGQGFILESLWTDGAVVDVRYRSGGFASRAQRVGRMARALSRSMPPSVETFRIVPVTAGLPSVAVVMRRSDLEALVDAPNGEARLLAVTGLTDPGPRPAGALIAPDTFPRFAWRLGPYVRRSYFDPAEPVKFGFGLRLGASYEPVPGLVFAGAATHRLGGNIADQPRLTSSALPAVRTSFPLYDQAAETALELLQGAYYFKPGTDLYGRVTAGYLSRTFAGASTEILWKPVTSRLGLGVELNATRQREYELGLGFLEGEDAYDVVSGHASAYYALENGFHVQVDAGRYLAGDLGATLTVTREFRNGWEIGAFATRTDVSAEEFGEGSFDKGILFSAPVEWFTGRPSTRSVGTVIRPITRDGGARLAVSGRLYDRVRNTHLDGLEDGWGSVLR